MKHYTNKKTNEVFGYESIEDAKQFNDDYRNLVLMSDAEFKELKAEQEAQAKSHEAKANIDAQIKKTHRRDEYRSSHRRHGNSKIPCSENKGA